MSEPTANPPAPDTEFESIPAPVVESFVQRVTAKLLSIPVPPPLLVGAVRPPPPFGAARPPPPDLPPPKKYEPIHFREHPQNIPIGSSFFPSLSTGARIPWDRISGIFTSDSSSHSVFICSFSLPAPVHLDDGRTLSTGQVVVKSSSRIVEEVFSNLLAQRLGINVPGFKVVEYSDPEWEKCKTALKKLARDQYGSCAGVRGALDDVAFFLVFDHVPGVTLSKESVRDLLPFVEPAPPPGSSPTTPASIACSVLSPEVLEELGAIACFDVLINNCDRFPLLWNHDGNACNVMLGPTFRFSPATAPAAPATPPPPPAGAPTPSPSPPAAITVPTPPPQTPTPPSLPALPSGWPATPGHVGGVKAWAIDTVCSCVRAQYEPAIAGYLAKVRPFVEQMVAPSQPSHFIGQLQDLLGLFRVCLEDAEFTRGMCAAFRRGFARMVERIATTDMKTLLAETLAATRGAIHADWEQIWERDLARTDIAFLGRVAQTISEAWWASHSRTPYPAGAPWTAPLPARTRLVGLRDLECSLVNCAAMVWDLREPERFAGSHVFTSLNADMARGSTLEEVAVGLTPKQLDTRRRMISHIHGPHLFVIPRQPNDPDLPKFVEALRLCPSRQVMVLADGYEAFQRRYPMYCFSPGITCTSQSGFASEVLPDVFLGGVAPAHDPDGLAQCGITHVLNMAGELTPCPDPWTEAHIKYLHLPTDDSPLCIIALREGIRFVDEAVRGGGRVLVHCAMGMSRSATIVIGYAMFTRGWTLEQALCFMKTMRHAVNPNSGFLRQLMQYQDTLPPRKADPEPSVMTGLPLPEVMPPLLAIRLDWARKQYATMRDEAGAPVEPLPGEKDPHDVPSTQ